jgi:hypothetical protein
MERQHVISNQKETGHLGDIGIDEVIILKCILKS